MMMPMLIDDAANFYLADGVKFGETSAGKEVIRMAKEYAKILKHRIEAPRMPVKEFVTRNEDMSQQGRLRLFKQDDGDICVTVIDASGESAGIEFCSIGMGGGKSAHTLTALNDLALAMIEDNKAYPSSDTVRQGE